MAPYVRCGIKRHRNSAGITLYHTTSQWPGLVVLITINTRFIWRLYCQMGYTPAKHWIDSSHKGSSLVHACMCLYLSCMCLYLCELPIYIGILLHVGLSVWHYVCLFVCTYSHTHTHTYIHTHTHTNTHAHIHSHTQSHTHKHTHVYLCIYLCIYLSIHLRVTHKHTHSHIYMCVCVCVWVCASACLSVCLSVCLCMKHKTAVYTTTINTINHLIIYLSVKLDFCIFKNNLLVHLHRPLLPLLLLMNPFAPLSISPLPLSLCALLPSLYTSSPLVSISISYAIAYLPSSEAWQWLSVHLFISAAETVNKGVVQCVISE